MPLHPEKSCNWIALLNWAFLRHKFPPPFPLVSPLHLVKTQENRPTGERGTLTVALANSSLACGFPEEMQTNQTTLGCWPKHLWTSSIKVLKTLVLTQIFCSSIKTTGPPVSLFRETVCLWHLNKGVYLRNGWVSGKSYNKSSLCLLTFSF